MPGKQETNGGGRFHFDPDDPEYIKELQRPAVIKEDMNEMGRRKRVQQILDSKPFRKELEELIKSEKEDGTNFDHIKNLEQFSTLFPPRGQIAAANLHGMSAQAIVPIADLRGRPDAQKYDRLERLQRNKLAALYRLIDLFQWSQGIYNHVTLRMGESDEFLINPYGLLYHEVSASTLVKVNGGGEVLDGGSTSMGINANGFALHSAIYSARPNINSIIHIHTPAVAAVVSMKQGLLPICQEAMIIGPISYHNFASSQMDDEAKAKIQADIKPDSNVLMLRNNGCAVFGESPEEALNLLHLVILACETQVISLSGDGFVVMGESVEDAFFLLRNLIQASEYQIRAARMGLDNIIIPDAETQRKCRETARQMKYDFLEEEYQGGGGVNKTTTGDVNNGDAGKINWKSGELEWEAWMRVLDNAGFKSGHNYRQPIFRNRPSPTTAAAPGSSQQNATSAAAADSDYDVQVPPSASSYGELDDNIAPSAAAQRLETLRRESEKTRWLNSPNVYQKVEFLESGTSEPKKITKWIVDPTSPQHSTPVKITDLHQFSPVTTAANKGEFKQKQKAIKERRRQGDISAGPQSQILDGVTYEEMAQMNKDAEMSAATEGIGVMTIGTASKGIIERDFQHNAQVYRQMYAPNPFASETDEDIQKYMAEVKAKGGTPSAPPGGLPSSSTATSASQQQQQAGGPPQQQTAGSPTTDSPNPETVSLMQAARDHRRMDSVEDHAATAGAKNGCAEVTGIQQPPSLQQHSNDQPSSKLDHKIPSSSKDNNYPTKSYPRGDNRRNDSNNGGGERGEQQAARTLEYSRETTFDVNAATLPSTRLTEKRSASSTGGLFSRSKSERPHKSKSRHSHYELSSDGRGQANSDDEKASPTKGKDKKKKKSLVPSFLRGGKKDKKIKEDTAV